VLVAITPACAKLPLIKAAATATVTTRPANRVIILPPFEAADQSIALSQISNKSYTAVFSIPKASTLQGVN
jgi:hypothetical protein